MEVVAWRRTRATTACVAMFRPLLYSRGPGMDGPNEWAIFEIRTAGDPEQMIASVRKTILSVNGDLPVEGARPVVMSVDRTNAQRAW